MGEEDFDTGWKWIHVRGLDGNMYQLAERLVVSLIDSTGN